MVRILIADDHAIVRRGLQQILMDELSDVYIQEVMDAEALLQMVFSEQWDLVISDLSMPGRSGLDALIQVHHHSPGLPVLILSIHPEAQYAIRSLKAGAAGYLNKEAAPEELVKAVRRVLQGRKYITSAIAEKLAIGLLLDNSKEAHEELSEREFEVFKLLAIGKPVGEIADLLNLGVTTISTYRARILSKLNVKSNADLTLYAIEHKLI